MAITAGGALAQQKGAAPAATPDWRAPPRYATVELQAGFEPDPREVPVEAGARIEVEVVTTTFDAVLDVTPPGAATLNNDVVAGRPFGFPAVLSDTSDTDRRALHNPTPTHIADREPVRVAAGSDIQRGILSTPKETRIAAGRDIVDMVLFAQNLRASDVTRVEAGRDIIGTTQIVVPRRGNAALSPLPAIVGNSFTLGGPGTLIIDAGRDAGPFLNSAVASSGFVGGQLTTAPQTYGGGVLSVGNEYNPYLAAVGADIIVQFGVAPAPATRRCAMPTSIRRTSRSSKTICSSRTSTRSANRLPTVAARSTRRSLSTGCGPMRPPNSSPPMAGPTSPWPKPMPCSARCPNSASACS